MMPKLVTFVQWVINHQAHSHATLLADTTTFCREVFEYTQCMYGHRDLHPANINIKWDRWFTNLYHIQHSFD